MMVRTWERIGFAINVCNNISVSVLCVLIEKIVGTLVGRPYPYCIGLALDHR
jgi:ABC-type amino acid transport system permease subunit